jgi:hypothetical protein
MSKGVGVVQSQANERGRKNRHPRSKCSGIPVKSLDKTWLLHRRDHWPAASRAD